MTKLYGNIMENFAKESAGNDWKYIKGYGSIPRERKYPLNFKPCSGGKYAKEKVQARMRTIYITDGTNSFHRVGKCLRHICGTGQPCRKYFRRAGIKRSFKYSRAV